MNCKESCPLSKVRKILLATDGSQFSEGAIREAINFAKKCASKLYAITVLETNPEYETIASDVFEKEEIETGKHLESVKVRAVQEGVNCETIFHSGIEPHKGIVDEAAEKKVDMIIIGRRGRKGLAKLMMGEVAAQVIGHAPCKVLVVPRAASINFKNILVATDGSIHSAEAVSEAIGIAKCCGSNLLILSAMRDESERNEAQANVSRAAEIAQKEGVNAETLTPVGRSYDVTVETAGGRGVDLIVVGTYGKTGLKKILIGSSTKKVIENAGCAVLVVKAQ